MVLGQYVGYIFAGLYSFKIVIIKLEKASPKFHPTILNEMLDRFARALMILTGKNCVLLNSVQEWLLDCF